MRCSVKMLRMAVGNLPEGPPVQVTAAGETCRGERDLLRVLIGQRGMVNSSMPECATLCRRSARRACCSSPQQAASSGMRKLPKPPCSQVL